MDLTKGHKYLGCGDTPTSELPTIHGEAVRLAGLSKSHDYNQAGLKRWHAWLALLDVERPLIGFAWSLIFCTYGG
jgi:hypothetical protein